jgi:cobalt-zinc-cadmium efflux system membrane fusion protein
MASPSAPSPGAARPPFAWRRALQNAINWIVLAAIVVGLVLFLRTRSTHETKASQGAEAPPAKLSDISPNTLELLPQTAQSMHIEVVDVKPAPPTAPLKLMGWLYLEGSRLAHVQTVFVGRVIEVGQTTEGGKSRPLRPGDNVEKGQILAKLWSKEVGEKKSDLVDAISKLHLHGNVLKRLNTLGGSAIPLARLQEAERDYAADQIEIERLKRTLISWQISEEELAAIQTEAERIIAQSLLRDNQQPPGSQQPLSANPPLIRPSAQLALDRTWAELDIVAPMTGVILEKNFTVGDNIFPEPTQDMFKIADLSRLGVMANVYEEDLPKLVALPAEARRWQIELLAEPGVSPRQGMFETIGNVIDTTQHTAIVKGWLDNPDGQLRVGQFVTVTVDLPNRPGFVVVPTSGLIDDGSRTFVFVALNPERTTLALREVKLARRGAVMALLESNPATDSSSDAHPQPVAVGELVVTSGAVELFGALHNLETQRPAIVLETGARQ